MAQPARNRPIEWEEESAGGSLSNRILVWAGLAAVALGSAALLAQTRTGTEKLAQIVGHDAAAKVASRGPSAKGPTLAVQPSDAELERRHLADAVRSLVADRDRLMARLDAVERNLDVTASIPRETPTPAPTPPVDRSPGPPLPPVWSEMPGNIPPAAGVPPSRLPGAPAPPAVAPGSVTVATIPPPEAAQRTSGLVASEAAQESIATKTEFGIDLGGDSSFEGLRALWASIKGGHAGLLEGLRPLVAVREAANGGALELRLVVGPLTNAVAAARLCAILASAGRACQPTIFDGQRLALR